MYKFIFKIFMAVIGIVSFTEQANAQYRVHAIQMQGNVKTKPYIILRELPYQEGALLSKDSLSSLNVIAHDQLINTSLFTEVKVDTKELDSANIDIVITLKERWYFFPLPYFRWVDRNFSQWWTEQHRSLDRVNYGVNLKQSNFTGNNDRLVLGLITGYTQQAILKYSFPFIDQKLRFGTGFGFQYYTQKEINYTSLNDKQVFLKTQDVIRSGYRVNGNLSFRPNLYERHNFQIGLGKEVIADSAFLYAPKYLPTGKKSMSYVDLSYAYASLRFDYNAYPTKGNSTELALSQRIAPGAFLSALQLRKIKVMPLNKYNFIYTESNSLFKLLPNENYMDQKLLGYGTMQMNGLEYYVVEGNAATLFKAAWHHALGSITVKNPFTTAFLPQVKYQFWVKAFTNLGYVYSEHPTNASKLSNTLLRTAGIGMDIISIYDFVFKLDYSVNQLGEKGFYLHGGINF